MRYIDLPFNRMKHNGRSSFVAAAEAVIAEGAHHSEGTPRGVSRFAAVDEDETESGVFSDKDFRNMSLKVRFGKRWYSTV